MPKKFKGENSKASEAKARKDAIRIAEKEKVDKAKEDEFWRDDDKHVAKKNQRKEGKEAKRLEQIEHKKELQQMHEEEMASLKGAKPQAQKITRAQIMLQKESQAAAAATPKDRTELPIEENMNRLAVDGEEARTVEDAISVLGTNEPGVDKHPEKRMKAAYTAFEDARLPQLKQENPNLRLSQLKQILKKEWMKSPDNPLNQR